jgi:hypothetical protein
MDPIKPKYSDTVKVDWKITKKNKQIISQYAKYTKYDESEIIDRLIPDLLKFDDFMEWLEGRRYKRRINKVLEDDNISDSFTRVGDDIFEEIEENSKSM